MSRHKIHPSSFTFPFLGALNPAIVGLHVGLTTGDPAAGQAFAQTYKNLGDKFANTANELGGHVDSTAGVWHGPSGDAMRQAGGLLAQAGGKFGQDVAAVGSAFEQIVGDFQRISSLVHHTEGMAEGVVSHLVHLPFGAGIPAAFGYAGKTTAWVALAGTTLIKTGKDVMDLVHSIDGKRYEKAWAPRPQEEYHSPMAAATFQENHGPLPTIRPTV